MSRKLFSAVLVYVFTISICFAQKPGQVPMPDRLKGVILNAPLIDTPTGYLSPGAGFVRSQGTHLQSFGQGLATQGVYRLKVNPTNGEVDEVGVLLRSGNKQYDAAAVMTFFKWKFKPGAIRQLDVPVSFERSIIVNLSNAASR